MTNYYQNKIVSSLVYLVMLLVAISTIGGVSNLGSLLMVIQTLMVYLLMIKLSAWSINKIQSYINSVDWSKINEGRN